MKYNPGIFRDSMVFAESSSVSIPPTVTSAFSKPSVLAGVMVHSCACCSHWARAELVHAEGGCKSSQRSANLFGSIVLNCDRRFVRFLGNFGSMTVDVVPLFGRRSICTGRDLSQ